MPRRSILTGGRAKASGGATVTAIGDASTHSEEEDSPCSVCHSSSDPFHRLSHRQQQLTSFAPHRHGAGTDSITRKQPGLALSAVHSHAHPKTHASTTNNQVLRHEDFQSDSVFEETEKQQWTGRFGSSSMSKYATVCNAEHLRALLAGDLSCAFEDDVGVGMGAGVNVDKPTNTQSVFRVGAVERRSQSRQSRADHRSSWTAPTHLLDDEYANLMLTAQPNPNTSAPQKTVSRATGEEDESELQLPSREHPNPKLDYTPSLRCRISQKDTELLTESSSPPTTPEHCRKRSSPYPVHSTLRPAVPLKSSSPDLRCKQVRSIREVPLRITEGTASNMLSENALRVDLQAAASNLPSVAAGAGGSGNGRLGAEPSSANTCSSNESTPVPRLEGPTGTADCRAHFSRLPTYPAVRS